MVLSPRDLAVFEAIQRHGPLPSHYLYEFTKDLARNSFFFRKRLLLLTQDGYLRRPLQLNHPLIFTDFKVYMLGHKAEAVLREAKGLNLYAAPVSGGYQHAFMTACVSANIEIEVLKAGFKYISQEHILSRSTCPEKTRRMDKPLSLTSTIEYSFERTGKPSYAGKSHRRTEPDQLFGIDYGTGFRFFALEADRGTEPLTRPNLDQNSILRKILAYKDILIRREYKKQWGIPNLFPMFVTTANERADNMVKLTAEIFPNGSNQFLFKAIQGFHVYLRAPPLLSQLFTDPWKRTGDSFSIGRA